MIKNSKLKAIVTFFIVGLLVLGGWSIAKLKKPQKGDFVSVGNMSIPRYDHETVLLDDGRVLIIEGTTMARNYEGDTKSAEIYNPETKKFKPVGNLNEFLSEFTAIKLSNGKVLIIGGRRGNQSVRGTELYNPKTEKFEAGPDMNFSRMEHTATLLKNGNVLIVGGKEMDLKRKKPPCASIIIQNELYDPKTNKFSIISGLNIPRFKHSAALLNDGRVLILGGVGDSPNFPVLSSAEIYNPKINKFELAGNMNIERKKPNLYVLKNGDVIISGGYDNIKRRWAREIEIYNPKTNKFKVLGLNILSSEALAETLLKNDNILYTGGCIGVGLSLQCYKDTALYNPQTNKFIKGKEMKHRRVLHKETVLKDGNVLITGSEGSERIGKTAELYIYK